MRHTLTAIITDKRGRVLSVGRNSYTKTHTMMAKHANRVGLAEKTFQHAECNAIVRCKDLSKAYKISVFRYNKKGEPVNAKPCIVCQSMIAESGIKVIEWTTEE